MAKISTITLGDNSKNYGNSPPKAPNEIEDAKRRAVHKFLKRNLIFKRILLGLKCETIEPKYIIYGIGSIFLPILPCLAYTLIPLHNVMKLQEFWYELPLQFVFCLLPFSTAHMLFKVSFYINADTIKNVRCFVTLWLVQCLVVLVMQVSTYIIWTKVFHLSYPMPLNCYMIITALKIATFFLIWYIFPEGMRKDVQFRKRLKSLMIALFINQCMFLEYGVITKALLICPQNYQWCVALIMPFVREFNIRIPLIWVAKTCGGDKRVAEIAHIQGVSSSHSFFLTYTVGSIATMQTAVVILGIDFVINLCICLKLIRLQQKSSEDVEEQIRLLQDLVISEMIEFVVPLAYLASFIAAYYGPNSALIGNIGCGYWQYSSVEDVEHVIKYVVAFFFADLISLVLSAVLLWSFCGINFYRAYVGIQREFGIAFVIQMITILNGVCLLYCLNLF